MEMVDCPPDFRCPISMELMKEPVTISTGVTYERKNIEKWFLTYKKHTCPATMQAVDNFRITPNHTLARLILSWQSNASSSSSSPSRAPVRHDEMVTLLDTIQSSPFKVSSLKKLRPIIEMCQETKSDFVKSGGVDVLVQIALQILVDPFDFATFRACEEALGLLHKLPLTDRDKTYVSLSKPESMKAIATMLQRGSAEGRLYAVTIFKNMAKTSYDWNLVTHDQGLDFFKSLLELVSDEICTKASSCALEVLIEILGASKKSRVRAIEAGAMCVLVELLPESNRSRCEKMLLLMKMLCECAEGRLALVEHEMSIAVVSKKMLHVSGIATKIAVKILWSVCSFHPTERVLEEMLSYGAVKKLVALLHVGGPSSTKDKVVRIFKLHGSSWNRFSCFPSELNGNLGLVNINYS